MISFQDPQIRKIFFDSAHQYIQELNSAVLSLEAAPSEKEHLESIFRNFHSLKSESMAMGYPLISEICHRLEDLFSILREGEKTINREGFDLLFKVLDFLQEAIAGVEADKGEPDTGEIQSIAKEIEEKCLIKLEEKAVKSKDVFQKPKLDNIRVSLRILDRLMNIVEELTIERMKLSEVVMKNDFKKLNELEKRFDFLISDLQYYVTQSRLTPIEDIFQSLPRIIRDLTQKLNKKVNIKLDLGNLKVDRLIGETLYEPILHIIKNAIDHGIETKEERVKLGKAPEGTVEIKAYSDRGLAIIEVSDDGRGFDVEGIRSKLREKGVSGAEQKNDHEIVEALFEGGTSTAEKITEISGRGVGMNVVKAVMSKVGGRVVVDTKKDQGTTFLLEFPFTLAIIETILVKVKDEIYAVPVTSILKTVKVKKDEIQKAADVDTFLLEDEEITLLYLAEEFDLKGITYPDDIPVLVVKSGKDKLGLVVSEIQELEEIIVKPLTLQTSNSYFSGVTILGNDKTVLVLDIPGLMEKVSGGS